MIYRACKKHVRFFYNKYCFFLIIMLKYSHISLRSIVMISIIEKINSAVNDVVWGVPALFLLVGTGILMTVMLKFFQFTKFGHVLKETIGSLFKKKARSKKSDEKSISQFQALCTALSATVGTGNITGIALAITSGGPGAIFWMWIAAIVGMMTKFAESVLGIFFRTRNSDGEWQGGPMYYIKHGFANIRGMSGIGKVLSVLFAVFALAASFGIGNMGQIASISESIKNVGSFSGNDRYDSLIIGGVILVVAALVIIGGLKRIARANELLVPFMAFFYIVGAVIIIVMNHEMILPSFRSIFANAFNTKAVAGGVGGYVIIKAIKMGFKRGIFSNEAGLGSSVMVSSSSDAKEPVNQGLWGIFEVFFDTIIICTLTALVILTSGVVNLSTGASLTGSKELGLATEAFTKNLGTFGGVFTAFAVTLFAFSTVLGWSVYGSKAWEYLFGKKTGIIYKIIFLAVILVGTALNTDLIVDLSDTFNGLMAIPNLIGLLVLSPIVYKITRNYVDRKFKGKTDLKPILSNDPEIQSEMEEKIKKEA